MCQIASTLRGMCEHYSMWLALTGRWEQKHLDALVELKSKGTSWTEIANILDNGWHTLLPKLHS